MQEKQNDALEKQDEVTETTAMLGVEEDEEETQISTIEAWSRGGLTNKCGKMI